MCLLKLIKERMPLTLLCDWSAHLHMYLYILIQSGQSTESKCAKKAPKYTQTFRGWHEHWFLGARSVVLALLFRFAIGAERSVAESCISVCCVFVPAPMT
jgi:hypothetical protein